MGVVVEGGALVGDVGIRVVSRDVLCLASLLGLFVNSLVYACSNARRLPGSVAAWALLG